MKTILVSCIMLLTSFVHAQNALSVLYAVPTKKAEVTKTPQTRPQAKPQSNPQKPAQKTTTQRKPQPAPTKTQQEYEQDYAYDMRAGLTGAWIDNITGFVIEFYDDGYFAFGNQSKVLIEGGWELVSSNHLDLYLYDGYSDQRFCYDIAMGNNILQIVDELTSEVSYLNRLK